MSSGSHSDSDGTATSNSKKPISASRNGMLARVTASTSSYAIRAATSSASATGGVTCPMATVTTIRTPK